MKGPQKGPGELVGPYDGVNFGKDAYGHPVNRWGRCEQLNTTNKCPTAAQETTYLMAQDNLYVRGIASGLGINLGILPVLTNAVLVPLIIAILFPNG